MSERDNSFIPFKEFVIGGTLMVLGSGGLYLSFDALNQSHNQQEGSVSEARLNEAARDPASLSVADGLIRKNPDAIEIVDGEIKDFDNSDFNDPSDQLEELKDENQDEGSNLNTKTLAQDNQESGPERSALEEAARFQDDIIANSEDDIAENNDQDRDPKDNLPIAPLPPQCVLNCTTDNQDETTDDNQVDDSTEDEAVADNEDSGVPDTPIEAVSIQVAYQCFTNRAQGVYGGTTNVTLDCSELSDIKYCITTGATPCDPISTPNDYTAPVAIGPSDGVYSLSFYGVAGSDGEQSPVYHKRFQVDSGALSMETIYNNLFVQTTELPSMNDTTSVSFGSANHFYSQVNLTDAHDPGIEGYDLACGALLSEVPNFREPAAIGIESDMDVSVLSSGDTIEQPMEIERVEMGKANILATFVENRAASKVVCQWEAVNVLDFPMGAFSSGGATGVISGVRTTMGHFVGFGHFQATPNSAVVGVKENTQSTTSLKDDLISIMF